MKIVHSQDVSNEEWQRVADACDYATFFHTPHWYNAFSRIDSNARVVTRAVRFEDGKSAVLPLLSRQRYRGLVRRYETAPAGCYGGWISNDDLKKEHVDALCAFIAGQAGDGYWRINPFDPAAKGLAALKTAEDSTELLFLEQFADEESLRGHYRHSVRKQINKGERFGLRVRPAEDWSDWEAYYAIYVESLKRWGSAASSYYPIEFFRGLFDSRTEQIRLWLVTSAETIVGGNLNFYQGTHCVEWHAVFLDEYFRHGSRNFLVHSLVLDAKNRGCAVYDFNPSGTNEGTREFKRNFGTECVPSDIIARRQFGAARSMLKRAATLFRPGDSSATR